MKRIVQSLSLTVVGLSFFALMLMVQHVEHEPTAADPLAAELHALSPPAAGQPGGAMEIDLAADDTTLKQLTPREQEDQYRDWLLYAAVTSLNRPADQVSRIFFDLPAIRHGYLKPIGAFEYGLVRSRDVGDGEIVALLPSDRTPAQRRDDLAAIADQHRKNVGGAFKRLLVFDYALDVEHSHARIVRAQDVDYAALFSPAYGYVERTLVSMKDLQAFVGEVDDLTFVHKEEEGKGLRAGGRKLAQPMRTIGVEHIATVWQAQRKIQASLAAWDSYTSAQEKAFKARWSERTYRTEVERDVLESQMKQDRMIVQDQVMAEQRRRKLVKGVGFSLDPSFDFNGLRITFERIWPRLEPMISHRDALPSPEAVSRGLEDKNPVPFFQLLGELERADEILPAQVLTKIKYDNAFQAARYDGDLQGTEVGMVLFYTDLIAKLWTLDYADSSPARRAIRGFVDDPMVKTSLAYAEENKSLPSSRLWFGPATTGYQLADEGKTICFGRIATRIFSAGSNPEKPNAETQTSAFLAASIDWWNDHYEEVAVYEQEYLRLNQIMKWSALLAWLSGTQDLQRLQFLQDVPVDRSHVFTSWVKRHPELKYTQWQSVGFYGAGYKGATTEAMPMLRGLVTSGGVSLADETLARQAALSKNVEELVRRSHVDYALVDGRARLTTLDESVFSFERAGARAAEVVAKAKPGLRLRATGAQLAETEVRSVVSVERAGAVNVQVKVAGEPLGSLQLERVANGFDVGWFARDVDRAQLLALKLSKATKPDATLLREPTVESVIKFGGDASYAVKLRGSPRWIRFEPEGKPRVDLDPEWQLRAAGPQDSALRVMQAKVMEEETLLHSLGDGHMLVDVDTSGKTMLRWSREAPGPAVPKLQIETPNGPGQAWLDGSGAMHVSAKTPGELLPLARALRHEDMASLRAAASTGEKSLKLTGADGHSPLAQALDKQDFRAAAQQIAQDPVSARQTLQRQLAREIKGNEEILREQGLAEALHDLDALIAKHGAQPELTLRRGLLQLQRGNVNDAVAMAQTKAPRGLSDRAAFFDEINARRRLGASYDESLSRYAQFVDGRERLLREGGELGEFTPHARDGHFDFDITLKTLKQEAVGAADVRRNPLVYYEDSASLNRVDWAAPLDQTLGHMISGQMGRVIRLPAGGVANYRPAAIWSPDHLVKFKAARPLQHHYALSQTSRINMPPCDLDPQTGSCRRWQQEDTGAGDSAPPQEVYLVYASR